MRPLGVRKCVIAGTCLIVIYGALRAMANVSDVLLLGFFAVLIAVAFSFPVNLFSRWISRGWASLLTLILFFALFVGIGFSAAPVVSRQAHELMAQAPKAYAQMERWFSRFENQGALSQISEGHKVGDAIRSQIEEGAKSFLPKTVPAAINLVSVLSTFFLLSVLAAFLVHQPEGYCESLRSLVPRANEGRFLEAWRRLGIGLRHWMGGIIISMTIMGTLTALGLWLVGIEGWFTLGLITFFGTFVPYAGAIASSIPGLIIGLSQSSAHFFYALGVYVGIHIIEGYITQPFVMKKAVALSPALLLFWQALMGGIFGVFGIVIATPLLVCVKVLVGYFYIEGELQKAGPKP